MLRASFSLSLFGLVAVAVPAAAQNQSGPQPVGLSLGLRVGYAIPGGGIGASPGMGQSNEPLSDSVTGQVPLGLDLGYRITPHLGIGLSLQYGFAQVNDEKVGRDCPDCSADVVAVAASVFFHAIPGGKFDPWAGLGLGYELLTLHVDLSQGGQHVQGSAKLEGLQYLVLQLGGDFATGSAVTVGPYFAFSAGRYDSTSLTLTGPGVANNESRDIERPAWHEWVTFGLQGRFNF
jgi:outer membrane protein W